MFSALGLPPQRQDFRRIQTVPHGATRNSNESNSHPTHLSTNHLSAPSTAYNSPRDQKVYIKLSRPTPHNFQSTPATVRKQTYRPFCLIRGDLQEQALVKNKPISAPPCSPAPRLLGRWVGFYRKYTLSAMNYRFLVGETAATYHWSWLRCTDNHK